VFPIDLVGPADRVPATVLVVAELLSWGAAFTSLGLLLATWSPRIGRAVGISVAVFLLLSFGWLCLIWMVVEPALRPWLYTGDTIGGLNVFWLIRGLIVFSPVAAPISIIEALDIARAPRWLFWAIASCWCLLT
jgi:hypothetical protein